MLHSATEVEGERGRGRPPFRWKDGFRRACAERNMGLEEAIVFCLDRGLWRMRVDSVPDGLWACVKCGRRHILTRCEGDRAPPA